MNKYKLNFNKIEVFLSSCKIAKKPLLSLQIFCLIFLCSNSNAQPLKISSSENPVKLINVAGIGGGLANIQNLGKSQYFPIQNIQTDEFYVYSALKNTANKFLFDIFIGKEKSIFQNWLVQGTLTYQQIQPFKPQGYFIQGADNESADAYKYNYKVVSRQFLVQTKWFYNYQKIFKPYVLGGLGAAFNRAYNYQTKAPRFLTFTRAYANNTQTSFAYQLGLGFDVPMNNHLRLGLSYRFLGLGRISLGAVNIDNIPVAGTLSSANAYVNQALLELTTSF